MSADGSCLGASTARRIVLTYTLQARPPTLYRYNQAGLRCTRRPGPGAAASGSRTPDVAVPKAVPIFPIPRWTPDSSYRPAPSGCADGIVSLAKSPKVVCMPCRPFLPSRISKCRRTVGFASEPWSSTRSRRLLLRLGRLMSSFWPL
ncbi:hypothetical protein FA95DRAFT_552367 [Auriscalpium vulgare]|uniref:Uncharacterized protein n=1 Tax=Auriscalpium vulgare TaxID=40419 RepID=A0ACB8S3Q6_9AGAM|nr:hypothetical protein FA95DRAFT_552367 [Auriscalpium vulgare]